MDMFIKDPEATAEQIAGTMLCPPLPHSLSLSLIRAVTPLSLPVSLFLTYPATFSSPLCLPPFQLQTRKTPNQLASEPVSQSVGQSALQRALPIIICFFSCCSAGVFPLHKYHNVPAGVKPIHLLEGPYHFQ